VAIEIFGFSFIFIPLHQTILAQQDGWFRCSSLTRHFFLTESRMILTAKVPNTPW